MVEVMRLAVPKHCIRVDRRVNVANLVSSASFWLTFSLVSGVNPPLRSHSTYSQPSVPRFISCKRPRSTVFDDNSGLSRRICLPSAVDCIELVRAGKKAEAVLSERVATKSPLRVSKTPTVPLPTAKRAFCAMFSGTCLAYDLNRLNILMGLRRMPTNASASIISGLAVLLTRLALPSRSRGFIRGLFGSGGDHGVMTCRLGDGIERISLTIRNTSPASTSGARRNVKPLTKSTSSSTENIPLILGLNSCRLQAISMPTQISTNAPDLSLLLITSSRSGSA